MYNIILLEDDLRQNLALESRIKNLYPDSLIQLYSYIHAQDMMDQLSRFKGMNIYVLDIVLDKEASGIDIAKQIHQTDAGAVIIFISAYLEKVTDVYETEHCYFIFKPEVELRLKPALDKAMALCSEMKKVLVVETGAKTVRVPIHSIYCIERIKRYSLLHGKTQTLRVALTFEELFPDLTDSFQQCHQSFIVNFDKVKEHTRTDFILINDQLVPISRSYAKKVNQSFQYYLTHTFK